MQSVMRHDFSQVPSVGIQRSKFKMDHGIKTTFNAGFLIPIFWFEALPGDTLNVRMNAFGRMATPIHPLMDNLFLETFFFAIPNRLVWENWEKFCGAQDNPSDSTDYQVPYIDSPSGGFTEQQLFDYFGIPTKVHPIQINALYFRAYNLVWNEWFRDQNLQNSIETPITDGPDSEALYRIRRRGKRHDYFTSCLPWPQKDGGNPVLLPLGTRAPVHGLGVFDVQTPATQTYRQTGGTTETESGWQNQVSALTTGDARIAIKQDGQSYPDIYADLTNATAATINDLREAFQIQRMYEKDARGGTRYVELLKAHFQVVSPDFRLQRPEYLGGGSSPVNINPVTQTSETGTQPQGSMAAFGTVSVSGHGFTKSFVEHSIVIGLVNVRADLTYQQGIERAFSRQTRFDYFWPSLANLGEQAVLSKEIFATGVADDELVFGYQERWAEYRYKQSRVTGLFRSNATQSLDPWHLSLDFADRPLLNSTFISDNPPMDRVLAVPDQPEFILDTFFNMSAARPMPVNSVPGLIDHF